MENKKYLLTVAMGTYNRADMVEELVKSILEHKDLEVEVVVVDNASTDDTVTRLQQIDDERFKLFCNEENLGGAMNVLKAIKYSTGKYVFYSNDREIIFIDALRRVMSNVLADADYSVVYTRSRGSNFKKSEACPAGFRAISSVYGDHPTGIIFNRDLIAQKHIEVEDYNKYRDNCFVWKFLEATLKCYLPSYRYQDEPVWKGRGAGVMVKNPSRFMKERTVDRKLLYIMPEFRMELMKTLTQHLYELEQEGLLNHKDFSKCCYRLYAEEHYSATKGYKSSVEDPVTQVRYGLEKDYKVSKQELSEVSKAFAKEVKALMEEYNMCSRAYCRIYDFHWWLYRLMISGYNNLRKK